MAQRRQVLGVPAGAAGGVQRDAARQVIEDVPDNGLIQVDEPIPRLVIGSGPGAIALPGLDRASLNPAADLVR